jgi:hypothetical protein
MFFLIFINFFIVKDLLGEQEKYANIMPFIPEDFIKTRISQRATSKLGYNFIMHNIEDAVYIFEENTDLVNSEALEKYYADWNNVSSEWHEQAGNYNFFIIRVLESLILMNENKKVFAELERWNKIIEVSKDDAQLLRFQLFNLYFLFETNQINEFQELLSSMDIENITQNIFKKKSKYLNGYEVDQIKYLAKLTHEYYGNIDLTLELLEFSFKGYYQQQTVYEKARIIAENEINDAIILIETELDKFFEEGFYNPMQSYSNNIERSRMFLAYLYYKIGNNEKALYNFELAITSKEQGSTFMGDWDYWLNYRDYYKDEYNVLLKLKEMYLEKQ